MIAGKSRILTILRGHHWENIVILDISGSYRWLEKWDDSYYSQESSLEKHNDSYHFREPSIEKHNDSQGMGADLDDSILFLS